MLALALQFPVLVGGVYSLPSEQGGRWPSAGAWQLPVGGPTQLGTPASPEQPPFKLNRGLEFTHGRLSHTGADLADGRAGDTVRAAASGLVALACDGDNGNGYGGHVVLAHRLAAEDRILYTVYAHLERGSVAVRCGDMVCGGDPIGRVGQTGRASTPHLHFEVRAAENEDERWEKARVLDPLEFVCARLAPGIDSAATAAPYLRWAAAQDLASGEREGAAPLTRGAWWRMLARVVADGPDRGALAGESLRDSLMDDGVLPEEEAGAPADEPLAWAELARDVQRLHRLGVRLPHGPLPTAEHTAQCEQRFAQRAPASHAAALRRLPGEPTLADACLVLADLSGPPPAPHLRGTGPEATVAGTRHAHRGKTRAHRARTPRRGRKPRQRGKPVTAKRGHAKSRPTAARFAPASTLDAGATPVADSRGMQGCDGDEYVCARHERAGDGESPAPAANTEDHSRAIDRTGRTPQ